MNEDLLKKLEKLPIETQKEFIDTFEKYTVKTKESKIHSDLCRL